MKKLEELLEWGGMKRDILFLAVSGIALLISIFDLLPLPFDAAWIAIIFCGIPIVLEAVIGLVTAFDIKADVLVSIALIASVLIGEDFAAGEVAFIMQLGALLEELTVARARAGIEKLVHLTPRTARIIAGTEERIVPAEQVRVGELLRVLPGETVPVDGVIVSGQTSINQAVMTGESLPVDKGAGDEVSSGTVNQFGAFDMKAVKVGEDSSIQRMIRLVQSADAGESENRGTGGPVGHLDRRDRADSRGYNLVCDRTAAPLSNDLGGILPLRSCPGDAYGDHGRHRQRDPPWLFSKGRRRFGTSGLCFAGHI